MPRKQHTHKYERRQFKYSGKRWACRLPNCLHYIPIDYGDDAIIGRESICWECSTEFVLDDFAVRDDQPRCKTCREKTGMEILERRKPVEVPEDMPIEDKLRKAGLLR